MRIYSASSEEALRARKFLKDWVDEGFVTDAQYRRLEQDTVCEFRTTNIFLRLVLFLFTLIIVGAGVGLFVEGLISSPPSRATGVLLLIFAAVSYAAAEFSVSQFRLYRYGIEEAFAVGSVGFLCLGMQFALFSSSPQMPAATRFVVPAAGALWSLWIWRRFGLPYAFLAAMIFIVYLPDHWAPFNAAQHLLVAGIYAALLAGVAAVRSRHRFDYLNDGYSFVEALLWLGIYLAFNLQISSLNLLGQGWGAPQSSNEFSRPFYWATWVLTWCLPPGVLARGVLQKDRFVIAAGAITALLTFVTNKPYLGWPRHTWDPMLLGALLIGVAPILRRWLAAGPGGTRYGFTAQRLSAADKQWMDAGSAAIGLVPLHSLTPSPQAASTDVRFGGGDSGGGGASSDF